MSDLRGPWLIDCRREFGDVVFNHSELVHESVHVRRNGGGPGSLTDEGLNYRVVDGLAVRDAFPQIERAYYRLADKVAHILGVEVEPSIDEVSRVNVNLVEPGTDGYEWHTDSQPWTVLLFATEHRGEGGRLLVRHPELGELRIPPVLGQGVLFDGQALPHRVQPVNDWLRITVPMVFKRAGAPEIRPEGTDDHLYQSRS